MSNEFSSPLLDLARTALRSARFVSPQWLLGCVGQRPSIRRRCGTLFLLRDRQELDQEEVESPDFTTRRARAIDNYVMAWLAGMSLIALAVLLLGDIPQLVGIAVSVVAGLRILEIARSTVNTAVFDNIFGRPDNLVASHPRIVLLALVNYIEVWVCFTVLYAAWPKTLHPTCGGSWSDAPYFSLLTQVTVSFGDPVPVGWGRVVAMTQATLGVLFLVLILGRLVASQAPIHTIATLRRPDPAPNPSDSPLNSTTEPT